MPIAPGTRLGPYEIASPLGAGGMGEVYRARDTRLGRDVALKVLHAEVAADPSRRQRFELEARAVAALNHPNIVALFDVGEGYIVSELVDGETLRGAKFSLRKTLDIVVQIAGGLAAAHAAGITHRDLKPDNILLTRDGRVKILDFGLAKLRAPHAPGAAGTQTMTVRTDPGAVMGTVGYMSPEQVRGLEADHRSDIFSLGAILHELLTGSRAFQGETSVDTMQAILRQDPAELPDTVPPALRQMVAHCLEKDPANRFQSVRDLGFALSAIAENGIRSATATAAAPLPQSRWRRPVFAALAGIALVAAGAIAAHQWWKAPPAPLWKGVLLGGPEVALFPRLAPDGHLLAFAVHDEQIAVMKPESGNWTVLTHAADVGFIGSVSWSPDGARIYYDRATDVPGGIYSVPVLGGPEQLILENAGAPEALPDGSLLVSRLNAERLTQLFRYWPETGRFQAYPLELTGFFARSFPGGREAIAIGSRIGPGRETGRHVYVVDLQSGAVRRFLPEAHNDSAVTAVWVSRDGRSVLLSFSAGNLVRIAKVSSSGEILVPALLTLTGELYGMEEGADGSIYLDNVDRPVEIARFSAVDGHAERIAALPNFGFSFTRDHEIFAILPDGRAVATVETNGRAQLVSYGAGHDPVSLVNTAEETSSPATAVGSGRIAFMIGPEPRRTIALAATSNGRIERRIPFDKGPIHSLAASPDGKTLYCAAGGNIWSLPLAGGDPRQLRAGDYVAMDPAGKYLVVEVVESPMIRLIRVPLDGGAEQEIRVTGPLRPAGVIGPNSVGKDGRIVMPLGSANWYWPAGVLDPATGRFTRIPVDRILDYHILGWMPDGKVIGLGLDLRSKIWKFTPDVR